MTLNRIQDTVRNALGKHISPAKLNRLLIYEETDATGDPVLRIRAVIEADGPDVSAEKVFTATSVVREALAEIGENRFPLLTYPSSDELPEVAA